MDVASAGMAISTVDNAVMVAASTCTCFFSELLGGNNQRQPGILIRGNFIRAEGKLLTLRARRPVG